MIKQRCCCPGEYYEKYHRWRVLRRAERSLVYCLDCRSEWMSKARYVVLLPDHRPRSRRGLTDDDILALINSGAIRVICNKAEVWRNGRRLEITEREHPDGPQRGTYRFVTVCSKNKKKRIALHRLVWMAANLSVPPEGYDIDHIHSQEDDTIGNLRLLSASENRATNTPKQKAF